MRRLHHDSQFHRTHAALKSVVVSLVVRTRGPREVMNVVSVVSDGLSPVGIVHIADFDAAGSDHFELRHGELDVVNAEVREKFRVCMKLMAIPGAMPPNADLGKPLAAEHKVAIPTGALQRLRKLIVELYIELDVSIWGNRIR